MMDFKSEHFKSLSKIIELEEQINFVHQVLGRTVIQLERYQKAYHILSEHFDLLPEEVKESVDQALKEEDL